MEIGLDGKGEQRVPGLPPGASIPVYSPDGSLFAFTAPGGETIRDLWVGTADGTRIEAVTDKLSVRSIFWAQDSRKIYFETGKTYGTGMWEMDLSKMESKSILSKYIGTPAFSHKAGEIAMPYPVNPGEFEIYRMRPDGSDVTQTKAPHLAGRWLSWDAEGTGVYYLGQDLVKKSVQPKKDAAADDKNKSASPHDNASSEYERAGVNSVWHLDLKTGAERRVTPPSLHVIDFEDAPGGGKLAVAAVLEKSVGPEIFVIDPALAAAKPLASSRSSAWMPVISADASKIAFFTNEESMYTLRVATGNGNEIGSYPGFILEQDSKIFWLPQVDGVMVFSGRGLVAFTEKGPIEFANADDLRGYLYADVSIQEDKVVLSAIPRYGETPGLYTLEVEGGKFKLKDLRFPSAPEIAADRYLQPKWSLNGKKIAFADGIDVWVMKSDGTDRKRITRYAEHNAEKKGNTLLASFPVLSVMGEKICYTVTVYEEKRILREFWLANADGSEGRKIHTAELDSQFQVFQPEYTYTPFFDASDERIIFTSEQMGIPNIASVDLATGALSWLTTTGAVYPALFPEEGTIIYTSLEENVERLWLMNADGSNKRIFPFQAAPRPAAAEKAAEPVKSPEAASAAPAGKSQIAVSAEPGKKGVKTKTVKKPLGKKKKKNTGK